MENQIDFLKSVDLLAGVPNDLLVQIGEQMEEIQAKAGTTIIRSGDPGDAVYLVVEGSLRLEREGILLVSRQRGECVGEFALIDDAPRSASVVADTDVLLLRWEREDFQKAFSQSLEVACGILRILTGKLRQDIAMQVEVGLEQKRWREELERAHEIQTMS